MIKKLVHPFAIALAFLLFQSPAALANHCGCMHGHMMHGMIEKLDLTKEQKDKIKDIMDKSRSAVKNKRDEMHDIRMSINEAYANDSMTKDKIDEFVKKEEKIVGAMLKMRMMDRLEISKVLTKEQREKLNVMAKKHTEERKDHGSCEHKKDSKK